MPPKMFQENNHSKNMENCLSGKSHEEKQENRRKVEGIVFSQGRGKAENIRKIREVERKIIMKFKSTFLIELSK